jgi:hypothetical protein
MADILHSLYGRVLGLTKEGYLAGKDSEVTAATSASTGTDIPAGGVTTLSSAASVWRLDPPIPGVRKTITSLSTSTANRAVTCESGTINSSGGGSFASIVFQGLNYNVELVGLSTAKWGVVGVQNAILSPTTST